MSANERRDIPAQTSQGSRRGGGDAARSRTLNDHEWRIVFWAGIGFYLLGAAVLTYWLLKAVV